MDVRRVRELRIVSVRHHPNSLTMPIAYLPAFSLLFSLIRTLSSALPPPPTLLPPTLPHPDSLTIHTPSPLKQTHHSRFLSTHTLSPHCQSPILPCNSSSPTLPHPSICYPLTLPLHPDRLLIICMPKRLTHTTSPTLCYSHSFTHTLLKHEQCLNTHTPS